MSLKLKWALIVGAFLMVAGVALVVGFQLSGFDVIAWFGTRYAMYVYISGGLYLMLVAALLVNDYVFKK